MIKSISFIVLNELKMLNATRLLHFLS